MKISYDLGFAAIGVAIILFLFIFVILCARSVFLRNRLREYVPAIIASDYGKVLTNSMGAFWK